MTGGNAHPAVAVVTSALAQAGRHVSHWHALLCALVWAGFVLAMLPAHAADAIARAQTVQGEVTAQAPDAAARMLRVGSELYQRDRIITRQNARIRITFNDESSVSLGSRSELTLDRYDPDSDDPGFAIRVTKGIFRVVTGLIARSHPASYRVNTPVATIGIRGTHFGGEVHETSAVIVLLEPQDGRSSAIEVSNEFGAVIVDRPGFGTDVPDASSPPSAQRRMQLRAVDNLIRSLSTIQRLQIPRPR